jgi:hypothetical protein
VIGNAGLIYHLLAMAYERRCFICAKKSYCAHREPEVELAILQVRRIDVVYTRGIDSSGSASWVQVRKIDPMPPGREIQPPAKVRVFR